MLRPNHPDEACSTRQAESSCMRRLSTESVKRPNESRFTATKTNFIRESSMRSKLMLSFAASAAVVLFHPTPQTVWAQGQEALTGTVSSEAEGNMEGVVVPAKRPGSIVEVSVTTDAQGRYVFPENRLDP